MGGATALVASVAFLLTHGGLSAGSAGTGSYAFLERQANGSPVTYSSCRSVPVEFNLHGVDDPDATRRILLQALGQASAASHLNLVYVRDSIRRPSRNWGTMGGYPVLIGFSDASEIPIMDGVAGRGGSSWTDVDGHSTYISGQIVLERGFWNRQLDSWRGDEEARAVVMHELGHVLGLGHVQDDGELMNADNVGRTEWGPGDRKGLAVLGKGPCT